MSVTVPHVDTRPAGTESPDGLRLSVLVPNRNHSHYLPRSLGSLEAQTRAADEVIIIDDGSTDDSVRIIEEFVARNRGWRLVRHVENEGTIVRLNEGLALTDGDGIAFLGADDAVEPYFLERMGGCLARHPQAAFAFACVTLMIGDRASGTRPAIMPLAQGGYVPPGAFRRLLAKADNFFPATALLYRTSALRAIGGFNPLLGSFADSVALRALAVRQGFAFEPELLGRWYLHETNYSLETNSTPETLERGIAATRHALDDEPQELYPPGFADTFERRTRFHSARVVLGSAALAPGERARRVSRIVQSGPIERAVLSLLVQAGRLGRIAGLVLLTLRLRPMNVLELPCEYLRRRVLGLPRQSGAVGRMKS